jgi:hypothetical protein
MACIWARGDGDPKEARERLGRDAQIGITCHNSRHLAMEAGDVGADYVAFGAFYPTTTKATEHVAEPDILTWWQTLPVGCVAIGGITPANAAPLVRAGADFWPCRARSGTGTRPPTKALGRGDPHRVSRYHRRVSRAATRPVAGTMAPCHQPAP